MSNDIVERLRDYHATVLAAPPYYRELTQAAADEIERLRDLIDGYHYTAMGQRDSIKRLQKERDEARWRLCKVVGDNRGVWGCEIAKENGWDYLATESKP